MNDLIKALQILEKYMESDTYSPTHCEHDILYVPGVNYNAISPEDREKLEKLGFQENTDNGCGFMSYRFGSC